MTDPQTPAQTVDPEEQAFLAAYDPGVFPRPSVATDVVVLTVREGRLVVALYQRAEHPHRGRWALPGGFVRMDEALSTAARRLLRDKVGVQGVFLEQLYTFGDPGRDPRMRIITVAYLALVPPARLQVEKGALAAVEVDWAGEAGGPARAIGPDGAALPIAFDHADILGLAVQRLRGKLRYSPVAYAMLPPRFTLRALQSVHEAILGEALSKPAFRRRLLATGELRATGELESDVDHRPAELYEHAPQEEDAS
ncbi:MAG: NUDIX hydrolase [Alphaproteobacteria bacterium]|nr:NUDIX hydrolase [Alphaproteobacteria bacterium]